MKTENEDIQTIPLSKKERELLAAMIDVTPIKGDLRTLPDVLKQMAELRNKLTPSALRASPPNSESTNLGEKKALRKRGKNEKV